MILADCQIRNLCLSGLVDPYDPSLVNPASLDVRLGPDLLIESVSHEGMVPLSIADTTQDRPYFMRPGSFVLGATIETVNMPRNVAAQFALKSSRGREGIEHLMAGFIDPGFYGSKITLELCNARQLHPVPIWHGMRIGQLVFQRMSRKPFKDYSKTGRYNNDLGVTPSKGHA
jgi:dCTP deaminase